MPNPRSSRSHSFPAWITQTLRLPTDRRDFITKATAVVIGGSLTVVPAIAGLCVFLDPLRREIRKRRLSPRRQSQFAARKTANHANFPSSPRGSTPGTARPNVPVGAVYLQRLAGRQGSRPQRRVSARRLLRRLPARNSNYFCPCHNSSFALDGKIHDPKSPSPRALDELPVEIRNGTEVWVTFQNFRAGVHEKIPV